MHLLSSLLANLLELGNAIRFQLPKFSICLTNFRSNLGIGFISLCSNIADLLLRN